MLNEKKVVWLAHGYGYHGDLMYFAPLLRGYIKKFPNTRVFVEPHMIERNDKALPLDPCLRVKTLQLRKPSESGDYGRVLDLPSPSLCYHLLKSNPDLLVLFDFSRVTWLGAFTARLLPNCRILLLVESDPKFRGVHHQGIQLAVRKLIARQADALLTNNHHGEAYLTQTLGADRERIIARPYLTSQPGRAWMSADDRGWEAPTARPMEFLFMNSINHRKGVDYMIRAIGALDPERRKAMHLRVVGDGPQRPEVERLTDELNLQDTIEFVGSVPYHRIADYYRTADVFVAPTLRDYRSLTGFEALSFAMPILMSCYDGAHEEVVDIEKNGVIFDPRNTPDFAAKFAWFIDNRTRLPEMRRVSLEINQKFTVEHAVDNLAFASEQALSRHQRHVPASRAIDNAM